MAKSETAPKLNMENIQEAARDYAVSTGVECLILTENGTMLLNPGEGEIHHHLCYQFDSDIARCCINTHKEGVLSEGQFSSCGYYCPMGLFHWSAPIIKEGKIRAAFVAGHTFLNQSKDSLASLKHVTNKHAELLGRYPSLKESLLHSPVIDTEKLDSMKRLLDRLAESFSDHSLSEEAYRDMRNAFRSTVGEGKISREMPFLKLTRKFETAEGNELCDLAKKIAEEIRHTKDITVTKQILGQSVLRIYDRFLENEGQTFLVNRALEAMNLLDAADSPQELAEWAETSFLSLRETAGLLPDIKNANMIYMALQYIDDHYSERFTLQDIADYVHFSAPYFSKVFKREMDTTFSKYLTGIRIERSKALLKNESYALADIPSMVGFEEQSYFIRVFRAATGVSPGRYRKEHSERTDAK